jgi:hypothetical protein
LTKLHNEELRNLLPSPDVIRVIKWWKMKYPGHVTSMGEIGNTCRILVGRPFGRLRYTLDDNI